MVSAALVRAECAALTVVFGLSVLAALLIPLAVSFGADFLAEAAAAFVADRAPDALVGSLGFGPTDDGLSEAVSAAAVGVVALANATPIPRATVAAAARAVSGGNLIECSNGRGSALADDAAAAHLYQLRDVIDAAETVCSAVHRGSFDSPTAADCFSRRLSDDLVVGPIDDPLFSPQSDPCDDNG